MSAWQTDMRELHTILAAATGVRHLRDEFVDGEPEWARHERSIMHDATNIMRARYQKPPVSEEQIRSAETRATGHVDYVQKFAIGCADLVHDSAARVPNHADRSQG